MASLAIAPPDVKDVTLSLFAGRKTDIAPSDLPEGLTPDEQDGIYVPGEWLSRPGLARLYAAGALSAGTSVLYEKTYVQPNDDPLTLILTSDGVLWAEDVGAGGNPGAITPAGQIAAGLRAQSVTEFGREYLAFSDLLHGQGVPLQFDGTNLDRVTMDGPGAPPLIVEENQVINIPAGPNGTGMLSNPILAAPNGLIENGNVVTVKASGGNNFTFSVAGDLLQITGAGVAAYNGTWTISKVIDGYTCQFIHNQVGLAASGGGEAATQLAAINLATQAQGASVGEPVTVAGVTVAGYNGTWIVRAIPIPVGFSVIVILNVFGLALSGGGTVTMGGNISQGTHQCVVMFLTRQGYITKPSPATWWIASGGKRVVISNIPIGPNNVVARIIGFTGAGGGNYFIIPASVTLPNPTGAPPLPITVAATVVPDNVTTTVTMDFPDNTLFAATPIDQVGNDLFDQVVLGPVLGFFAFASRLCVWGDYNKIENFLNMAFDGGLVSPSDTPPGWTVATVGGLLAPGGAWPGGFDWSIVCDGIGDPNGMITQPAYQDSFGDAILSPNTSYQFQAWIKTRDTGPGTQNVVAEFFSPSRGSLATATIALGNGAAYANGAFATVAFSSATPVVIPPDTLLRISANSSFIVPGGPVIQIDEMSIIFAENPYRDALSRWSYALNPEAFAQTTGDLGPSDDESPIRCFALLRSNALLESAEGVHSFTDNTGEPDEWNVNQLTRAVGAVSVRAGDPGKFGTGDAAEDWALVAGKNGAYLFAGAEFWKVSQEISRGALPQSQDPRACWDDINWAYEQTIVAKNDPHQRRAYFAVPLNGATAPNKLFVLDYREMDTATQIAGAPPLHITIQGKMRSSDLTRKWSVWNIPANDIEILVRANNQRELSLAGGANAQGQAFGNIYTLSSTKLTDDDYGQIFPYYTTYFFTDHETEQGLGIGSDIHLVKRIHSFVTGVGMVYITPIVNSLYNFQPALSPRVLAKDTDGSNFLKSDLEWSGTTVRGQRIAFRVSVQPLPGATDVQLRLQKFIVGMMKDPIVPVRQSAV